MRTVYLCLLAALAACTPRIHTDPDTGRVDVDMQPILQRGETWNGTLAGQGSASGATGTARAVVRNKRTVLSVTLSGVTAGTVHPWHLHEGTCGSGGPIVGNASAYPPLQVGNEGRAEGSATLDLALNEAKTYYVNIHASPENMGTIVACGEIAD